MSVEKPNLSQKHEIMLTSSLVFANLPLKTMQRKVTVKPKSSKAKNRLANIMENNPVCVVEQDSGGELFLVSENRKYSFWVSTRTGTNRFGDKADAHWEVIE